VDKNLEEAARWYERAAESRHQLAMYNLGIMLFKGMGIEADLARGGELIKDSGIGAAGEGKGPAA
jgi:TPR repeat protein